MGSDALRKGSWSAWGAPAVSGALEAAPARSEAGPRGLCAVACAGAVSALFACGNEAPECHGERCKPTQIDVMTWWATTGSSPGASLEDAAEGQPGVEVNLIEKASTKDEMIASLKEILEGTDTSEHVDAFLTHPGSDLLRWTPCGGDGPARVKLLNGPDGYPDLGARFDPRVLQGLQCCSSGTKCEAPGVYGVPLGLHQINHIIGNKERFAGCADKVVTNVDSLVELLSCLRADGRRVISVPVAEFQDCQLHDSSTCWKNQEVAGESLQYLLESLSLLVGDASAYQAGWSSRCWEKNSALEVARLGEAIDALDKLRPYLNNCAPDTCDEHCSPEHCKPAPTTSEIAKDHVATNEAAIFVAPDWVQFSNAGLSKMALRGSFPGTEGTFLFTTDSFALPSLPNTSDEAGLRWVDTLLKPEVQARFAAINGARPALTDHSKLPLLPSLEIQSPVNIDSRELRRRLSEWAKAGFSGPPPRLVDLMTDALRAAHDKGLLPGSAPDDPACNAP